jgi:xanthine dehydrogenase large subunit
MNQPRRLPPAVADGEAAAALPQVGVDPPARVRPPARGGEAPYVDDLPELAGTLHAALGLSPVAHGRLLAIDWTRLRAEPGVVARAHRRRHPRPQRLRPDRARRPDPGRRQVHYLGQPVFAVVATHARGARAAPRAGEGGAHPSRCPPC